MFRKNADNINQKIQEIISKISGKNTEKLTKELIYSQNIFLFGAGRSGLMAKAFAMRLVHLGKNVHFVGGVTTPAIKPKDVLLVVSGSGTTNSVLRIAEVAKKQEAIIISLTSQIKSSIAKISDIIINIPVKQEKKEKHDYLANQLMKKSINYIAPMGTIFELSVVIYLDSLIPVLMKKMNISEDYMKNKHANLE